MWPSHNNHIQYPNFIWKTLTLTKRHTYDFGVGEQYEAQKKLFFQIGNISRARKDSNSYGFSNTDVQRNSKTEYFFAQ